VITDEFIACLKYVLLTYIIYCCNKIFYMNRLPKYFLKLQKPRLSLHWIS